MLSIGDEVENTKYGWQGFVTQIYTNEDGARNGIIRVYILDNHYGDPIVKVGKEIDCGEVVLATTFLIDIHSRKDGLAFLNRFPGPNYVPCSRYGDTGEECAPIAWRYNYLLCREADESINTFNLEAAMSEVVNDSDNPSYIIRTYGHRKYT